MRRTPRTLCASPSRANARPRPVWPCESPPCRLRTPRPSVLLHALPRAPSALAAPHNALHSLSRSVHSGCVYDQEPTYSYCMVGWPHPGRGLGPERQASTKCGSPGAGGCAKQLGRHPHGVVSRAARRSLQVGPRARAPASSAFVLLFRRATAHTTVFCSEKKPHQSGAGDCVGGDAPRRPASAIALLYMCAVVVVSACSTSVTLLFSCVCVGGPEARFRV
jgi:hypothetical protein